MIKVLLKQMEEKKQKCEEAHRQYLLEKEQVDKIVQKLIEEDLRYGNWIFVLKP